MNEQKFNGKNNVYARFRPNYTKEFIEYLFLIVGVTQDSIICDIGSGTGILTKQLLQCVNKVFAVEPNDDMRKVAENDLSQYPNFVSIKGTAENTTIEDKSIDFITVAQAFHWFDKAAFKKECQRILKPNGKVILVWNTRDSKDKLTIKNDEISRKYCPNFKGFSGGMQGDIEEDNFSDFFDGEYESKAFDNPLIFEKESFIGRNLSSSFALKENDENYSDYVEELKALFDKYSTNGKTTMPNCAKSYVGNVIEKKI